MKGNLRERATAVVIRDGRVLLVRGRGRKWGKTYMMPGGGIEPGESPMSAASRELREETGLEAKHIEYLCTWESAIHRHHVFRVDAEGEVDLGPEVSDFVWWDQKEVLPTFSHVKAILERL